MNKILLRTKDELLQSSWRILKLIFVTELEMTIEDFGGIKRITISPTSLMELREDRLPLVRTAAQECHHVETR